VWAISLALFVVRILNRETVIIKSQPTEFVYT